MAFESIAGPLSDLRSDYQAAQIVSMLANLLGRDPKEHPKPYPIEDFRLFKAPVKRSPTNDATATTRAAATAEAAILAWMKAHNKRFETKAAREAKRAAEQATEVQTDPMPAVTPPTFQRSPRARRRPA